jgi:chemotaxis receptor (MCP) glutamine deamidase CheD
LQHLIIIFDSHSGIGRLTHKLLTQSQGKGQVDRRSPMG